MTSTFPLRKAVVAAALAIGAGALVLIAALNGPAPNRASAASHREAPLISMYPGADVSDFFMFRSYEPGRDDRLVLIMNVNPGSEPSSGPNYWNFDPSVVYSFEIDNDRDGRADDVKFEFKFSTEVRGLVDQLDLPLAYVGGKTLPPVTDLHSDGIGLRQRYDVWVVKNHRRKKIASGLIAVPSNVGPRTMPMYESLAQQGVYTLGNGARVFAGQRQDPFYIDLGGTFDTLNLRRDPPVNTAAEDENDAANSFGRDTLAGFNVSTIALELPISMVTKDRKGPSTTANLRLGAYAATTRPVIQVLDLDQNGPQHPRRSHSQIQRLANPLVNELIIGTEDKDRWNTLDPSRERQFLDYYLNPRLATALELIVGVPAAKSGRQDLVDLLLKYAPGDRRLSELLRLDLSVAPRPLAAQRRLTVLAEDNAGWPNGRRPKDDVTDIALRVVGGPNYVAARAADGVNTDDRPLPTGFPFLATPDDGRNPQHSTSP